MTIDAELQQTVNHQHVQAFDEPDAAQRAALAGEFIATLGTLTARGLHDEGDALARRMVELLPLKASAGKRSPMDT